MLAAMSGRWNFHVRAVFGNIGIRLPWSKGKYKEHKPRMAGPHEAGHPWAKNAECEGEEYLKLSELRREAELRKARNGWRGSFRPLRRRFSESGECLAGRQENNWCDRAEATGGWRRRLCGRDKECVDEEWSKAGVQRREGFHVAKVYPFAELREETGKPERGSGCRKSGDRDAKWGRERLKFNEGGLTRPERRRRKKPRRRMNDCARVRAGVTLQLEGNTREMSVSKIQNEELARRRRIRTSRWWAGSTTGKSWPFY